MKSKSIHNRIVFVSDAVYPYHKGGKEKRLYELSVRLAKKGYDVHIYCMKWWHENEHVKIENGITLHGISPYYSLYNGERRSIKQAILFSLHCFKLIKEPFDFIDADHMPHLVLFPLRIICMLKRKQLYATWNEVWGRSYWVHYLGILGNIAFVIEYMSARLPDRIVSISSLTSKNLRNVLGRKKNVYTIPIGIDYSHIQTIKPSKIKSDVIFVGRLLSHKNVPLLIHSIKYLSNTYPNIQCIIVGRGPEEDRLIKLSKELKIDKNVLFFNSINNHDEIYSLMKSSKVFAFPSTREGFGIVVLEANACGIPVIAVNHKHNAAKSLISSRNGFIADNSLESFSQTLQSTLNNYSKREKKTILQSAIAYDWNSITDMYEGVYRK